MRDFGNHPALLEVYRCQRELEAANRAQKEALNHDLESGDVEIWEGGYDHRLELFARFDAAKEAFDEALARWKPIKKELQRAELSLLMHKLMFWTRFKADSPVRDRRNRNIARSSACAVDIAGRRRQFSGPVAADKSRIFPRPASGRTCLGQPAAKRRARGLAAPLLGAHNPRRSGFCAARRLYSFQCGLPNIRPPLSTAIPPAASR
jgi:hypothetical protein